MDIQLYSDLHIEFEDFSPQCEKADVVVFAGDIHIGDKGLKWIKQQNITQPVIYVLGNHEYYKNTYPKLVTQLKAEVSGTNIHLLENDSVEIDGVCFHGCTLWTVLGDPRVAGYECQQVMTDFKKIRMLPNYSKFRSIDAAMIHKRSLNWLAESLNNSSSDKNVVVTHHAPSFKSVLACYKDDIVTSAYASNLEPFILEYKPEFWLHGHTHNSSDYMIDDCRVVCNPRGYSGEFNADFDKRKIIKLPY